MEDVPTEEFRFMKKGQVTKRIQGWMCIAELLLHLATGCLKMIPSLDKLNPSIFVCIILNSVRLLSH